MNRLKNCQFYVICTVTCEKCDGVGSIITVPWRDAFHALGEDKSMKEYGKWFAQQGYIRENQVDFYDLFPPMDVPCLSCGGKGYREKRVSLETALAMLGFTKDKEE